MLTVWRSIAEIFPTVRSGVHELNLYKGLCPAEESLGRGRKTEHYKALMKSCQASAIANYFN